MSHEIRRANDPPSFEALQAELNDSFDRLRSTQITLSAAERNNDAAKSELAEALEPLVDKQVDLTGVPVRSWIQLDEIDPKTGNYAWRYQPATRFSSAQGFRELPVRQFQRHFIHWVNRDVMAVSDVPTTGIVRGREPSIVYEIPLNSLQELRLSDPAES